MSKGYRVQRFAAITFALALSACVMGLMVDFVSRHWKRVHDTNAAYQKNAEDDREKAADVIAKDCQDPDAVFQECIREKLEAYYQDQATNIDLQAQQDMAFWAFWLLIASTVGIGISGFGVILLIRSINLGRAANIQATKATEAANEANQIMRDEQRPWLDITAIPSGQLTYMPDSNTVAIPFDIVIKNMGKGPAFNVAIDLSLAAVPDEGQGVLGGDAQFALNKRLIENAQRRSKNNNMTTTIFPDHPHTLNGWLAHAHFVRDGVKDGQKFGLIVAVAVAYGPTKNPCYISILPGPILQGSESGLFGFSVDDIKAGKSTFRFTVVQTAKLI